MQHSNSVEKEPLISHEQAVNAFKKGMSLFVGRGRSMSVLQLAKASRVHHRTIEAFRGYPVGHTDYRPLDWGQMLSIASVLGADFTNEWLPLTGQGAFDLPDDEPSPGTLASEVAEDAATVVRGINGGGVVDLPAVGARMVRHGHVITAMGARAA
ncbi:MULTISPECIES: hypothetical protein [unclassified Novosphingobium]|uniref:hypothetical protein n=1 Tax=unclassified Novosphingobium TaxID=2644732 RepID=UPI000D304501|nr:MULTISPECIES: hypothetical protein [unclassified Novosphingobium]PTR06410.1 hypothetical protein C8K11_12023 [Novosphingobium sp. GV055]PUA94829.1 hypothetical protein C8K12_12023 [Novosphingobium sp. GV061]PUB13754.1 hypothetical protein C8K14_12023 [Novosphingobium sp. GV079]PUB38452.1 hypothetical protein C8K10_12023 [Novosphingobium sp. GV027]